MTLCFLFVDDVVRVFLEERFCHGVGIFIEVVFRVLRSFSSFSCHILCSSRDRQSLLIIRSSTCVHRNLSLFDFTKASFVAINLAKVFAYIRLSEAHKAYHCRAPSDIACTSSPRNKTQNVTGRVLYFRSQCGARFRWTSWCAPTSSRNDFYGNGMRKKIVNRNWQIIDYDEVVLSSKHCFLRPFS